MKRGSITETQKNTVARWLEILKKEGNPKEEDGRLSRTGRKWLYRKKLEIRKRILIN